MGSTSKWKNIITKDWIPWRANPDNCGKSIDMWAQEHGVPTQTVYGWSYDKGIKGQVLAYFNDNFKIQTAEVQSVLINKAKTGDVAAIQLYAKWIENFREKSEVEHSGALEISGDQLREAVKNAKDAK